MSQRRIRSLLSRFHGIPAASARFLELAKAAQTELGKNFPSRQEISDEACAL